MDQTLEERCRALVADLGLGSGSDVRVVQKLTGGVASDIARVDLPGRSICVKFALGQLRVAADWFAPVHRSRAEHAWLSVAGAIVPGCVPPLYGYSDRLQGFAMAYLAGPEVHLWKAQLMAGQVDRDTAARLGDALGRIHGNGARPHFDRRLFQNAADFHALRVEPYLLFTATRHPALSTRLRTLADDLDTRHATLIHGDVSPKNIMVRAGQPIILDAECATMGDPAFDLAFCLNHLALKSIHLPRQRDALLKAAQTLWRAYAPHVVWEDAGTLQARVCALLPALMLARVDGKSPVEYLQPRGQAIARAFAARMIDRAVLILDDHWAELHRECLS